MLHNNVFTCCKVSGFEKKEYWTIIDLLGNVFIHNARCRSRLSTQWRNLAKNKYSWLVNNVEWVWNSVLHVAVVCMLCIAHLLLRTCFVMTLAWSNKPPSLPLSCTGHNFLLTRWGESIVDIIRFWLCNLTLCLISSSSLFLSWFTSLLVSANFCSSYSASLIKKYKAQQQEN